jgi:hypothetical protein
MKTSLALFLALVLPTFAAEPADPAKFVALDPTNAGPDFAIQGEYTADKSAAQVIALGGGKFRIVGWEPVLPGVGTTEKRVEIEATREGERVVFDKDGWKGEIAAGRIIGTNADGERHELKRIERTSPTIGAKPPEGAVVLFDGKDAAQWQGGQLDDAGNLKCGTKSVREFGDCTLHLEFRTPFKPAGRGQDRGNSGVYLQDRFEVQVLDSFGLKGENNECGGIYTIAKPKANLCFPPLVWQTYDIEFTAARYDAAGQKTANARATVRHNGVLIHENVELTKSTTSAGRKEGPEPGPIQLQAHGNPVVYRNIWLVEKK